MVGKISIQYYIALIILQISVMLLQVKNVYQCNAFLLSKIKLKIHSKNYNTILNSRISLQNSVVNTNIINNNNNANNDNNSIIDSNRRGTVEGSKFENCYIKTLEILQNTKNTKNYDTLIPIKLNEKYSSNIGKLGKSKVVFSSKAWYNKSLRYVRLISFVGEGYDVFNFLAIPR